ncbi:Proton-dependent oligopeptide transporter family [Macleaya cordata]|uniref:Proton-dependent oligopeptide transporter family n=1 Tax=Macleaya cordata TaxID=56857 RepID=A0A200QK87_MACCD|nr:Proton-dependent oligopeptide transporter family [Macleaya cordata]
MAFVSLLLQKFVSLLPFVVPAASNNLSAMETKEAAIPDTKPSSNQCNIRRGGYRATTFIFVLAGLENMGFVANMVSLVLYFMNVMYFDLSGSATTLTNFMGATFLLSLLGGFISDTYLNRLTTCLIFGFVELLGLMVLTIQAHYHKLQPDKCDKLPCIKGGQALLFYISLCLYAVGAGGVRGSVPALGGDQFDPKDPKQKKSLASYFNWLLLSITVGATLGVTIIVNVSTKKGWDLGFLICLLTAFVGFVVVAFGKPFYRIQEPGDSPIIRIAQVVVVAFRNRSLPFTKTADELYEINEKETSYDDEIIQHTNQFRCLDKAAILPRDSNPDPWKVCTVTQVEEVKILTRMFPILASTIIMNTCLAQLQTFSIQQGNIMDLHLGSFKVPPPTIPVIPLVFMSVLIPIYEFVFVPFARKITKHPAGITQLQRVGVGLVISAISMAVAAIVEVKRRNRAIKDPFNPISLFWLSYQYGIFGIADMFTLVGLLEFFYKEAPLRMKSLSTSFTWLSLSLGYFLSSVLVEIINSITKHLTKRKEGWLFGIDLNRNNLDLFYWFLAILSCLNFTNYLYWASWYKYKPDDADSDDQLKVMAASDGSAFNKEEATEDFEAKKNGAASPAHPESTKEKEDGQEE